MYYAKFYSKKIKKQKPNQCERIMQTRRNFIQAKKKKRKKRNTKQKKTKSWLLDGEGQRGDMLCVKIRVFV